MEIVRFFASDTRNKNIYCTESRSDNHVCVAGLSGLFKCTFPNTATSTSGLPVYFRWFPDPQTINGSKVPSPGVGPVVIEANQPGKCKLSNCKNQCQRGFTIGRGSQIITFPQLPNRTFSEEPFTLAASSSSGLMVHYRIVSDLQKYW
jgi:hypothetical protein